MKDYELSDNDHFRLIDLCNHYGATQYLSGIGEI